MSAAASKAVGDVDTKVYLSSVSSWEIATKHALGKLPLPKAPSELIPEIRRAYRIAVLSLDEESALQVDRLPTLHRDPFDRMLICQAIVHGLILLTPDEEIRRYPVRVLW